MITAAQAARALALIRLFNGTAALLVPGKALARLGTDVRQDPSGVYPLRMFGIRTVIVGMELLLSHGATRRRAARIGVLIHASDTVAAAGAGIRGQLPRKVAAATTLVSAVNTILAIRATGE